MELDVMLRLQTLEQKVEILEAILERSNQKIRLQDQMFNKLEIYVTERFELVDKHLELLNTRL